MEDEEFGGISYVAFSSNQIKSATDNIGTFDANNPDIRYSIDERDAEYFEAIDNGDLERARQLVRDAAEAAGYNVTSEYQGTSAFNGSAPWGNGYFLSKEERKKAWDNDVFDGDQTLADYIERGIDAMNFDFIVLDPRSYRAADANRREAIDNVRNAILSKRNTITMYRSVPAAVQEGSFRNGDWVTPSRGYAEENARIHGWGDNYNVIEQEVSTDDIWWDGNDIAEWGYGRESDYVNDTDFAYKNTKNNRKSLEVITYDKNGRIIPLSKRFNEESSDVNYSVTEQTRQLAYDTILQLLSDAGISVEEISNEAMRRLAENSEIKEKMLDTVLPEDESSFKGTVISSTSGAKILNDLDNAITRYEENPNNKPTNFLGDAAAALGATRHGSNSQYATFEAKNGEIVTIRLSDHNAKVSNFDNHEENKGVSIVISRKANDGMTNDGKANVTEYFYSDKQLKKSEGKPLADILKSIKQTLYSGEYKDTTGLAQVEEVNAGTLNRIELLRDGDVVYGAAVGGRIYLNAERLNPNTPVHEYTHLWDKACKAKNPELWNRGVELMKQTSIWNEVADDANYSGLGEHGIASEVHSRLAGNQGEELLTKMSADILAQGGSMMEKAQKLSVIELLKDWVKDFWSWVRDAMTPWSREETQKVSLEEFVSMPIASLAQAQKEELDAQEAEEQGVRYSIVDDENEIARLESESTIKTYRAMQLHDGILYPPMAGKVNGRWQQGIAVADLGKVWEKSDEHPELVDDKGYFTLNKGNGKSLKARYNPYIHTSLTPLNDQFAEAQDRPELVVVEVEVPESELTSGYKAEKAKDGVGRIEWKAGVIQKELTGTRTVILSRWDKPVRIVPDSEVADVIVGMIDGKDITMPSNVVTPQLRAELKKRGIPFVETDNNGKPRYSISEARVFTEEEIAQMETPILESKGTFKNLNEAEKWATTNLQGKSAVNEFTKERISIGRKSVEKMLSEKSQNQSISISAHIAALQSVLDFIRTGIPAEIHSDVKGREFSVMRLYNAIVIDGELYRVKSTVRKVAQGDKYYTYEIQEMEVIEERQANWKGEGINPRNPDSPIKSISGKDLLRGVKKTDSDELILSVANVENKSEKTNFSITEHFAQAEHYANLMSGDVQALNSEKMTDSLLDAYLSLPENIREEVIRLAPRKGYNFADAFAQYLADKVESEEEFTADDWTAVTANRDVLKKAYALDDLSLYDALWMTVQKAYPGKDILSRAHKVTLADNLGVDAESDEMKQIARQGVKYSISENMKSSSAAETYARATGYFKNRLKEGFVDMNESVNDLVEAIEMATGSKAESWEDIRYALNQQSSKGLARMEQYTRRYLQPLFDLLADITNNTKLSYEDVSRYVILRHAIERNEVFAKRDARRHYQEVYNAMATPLEKDKGMLQADRRVALSKADMRKVADIDSRIADIDKQLNAAKLNLAVHLDDINKGNDAIYLKNRETDYGGLTSMFSDYPGLQPRSKYRTDEEYNRAARRVRKPKYQSVAEMENAAWTEVGAFERELTVSRVNDLWKKINAATKETLKSQYEANMLSKTQYDAAKDQFKYYVPLRGFSDTTAEDVWSYYTSSRSDSFAPTLVAAKGRKSEAENPFNWIGTMASSAIAANVKNETKLALYYFIANRPNQDLVSMGKSWYRYDAQATSDYQALHPGSMKKFYSEVFPPATIGLNARDAQDAYRKWEEDLMRDRDNGLAYQSNQRMDVSDDVAFISSGEQPEHVIRCKVAGGEIVMTVNSNPRAAQAVNGLLNIEMEKDYQAIFGKILRFMSSVNTSYNPEFWISNAMRDILFATMSTSVNGNDVKGFTRHLESPRKLMQMAQAFREGTLGNSYIEKMFREFAENGAITGYTVINNNEYWEKQIQSTINR